MPESPPPGTNVLFLREAQIRQAQDLFFLAGRDLAGLRRSRAGRAWVWDGRITARCISLAGRPGRA